jgi:peptide/nickel transport system ATP-binding protein
MTNSYALKVEDLKVYYHTSGGPVKAVEGVSFSLEKGEKLGLVGESGSGKSTIALALMRSHKPPAIIEEGSINLGEINILDLSEENMRKTRLSGISMIPQGAMNSLNPVTRIRRQVEDAISDHNLKLKKTKKEIFLKELIQSVGLDDSVLNLFPHELSGGMKQRVCIAISISLKPKVIIADEPTSALDVIVQRQVIETLSKVQEELGAACVLIGHDMGLMAQFAHKIGIMYAGKLVEIGSVNDIFHNPTHPYTRLLIESLPDTKEKRPLIGIPGLPPSLLNLAPGCSFCLRIKKENKNEIPWVEITKDHFIQKCDICSDYGKTKK